MTIYSKTALGSLVKVVRGISYKSSELSENGTGVPMVNLRNVGKGGGFREDGLKYYTGEYKSSQVLNPGDLILANTDLSKAKDVLGSPFLVPASVSGAVLSLDLSKLVPDETLIDKRFLNYFLQSPEAREFMKAHGQGITVMHLRMTALPGLQVPVPPLEEQRRIVETLDDHLSRLDKALSELEHVDAQTLLLRRSILNELLNPESQGSEPGVERMIKNPEVWQPLPLSDVTSSISNGLTHQNKPASGGLPLSRIQTISKGEIDFELVGYAGLDGKGVEKYLLNPGDILFSHINSKEHVGKVAIYKAGMSPLLHGMNLLRIVANEKVLPTYLFWAFRWDGVRNQIWDNTRHAVNQASINIRNLSNVVIPVPPLDEQRRIVETLDESLSRLDSTRSFVASQKVLLLTLRRSLLNKAFNGELGIN